MNISEPILVETPKQITNLEAAKVALRADGSKFAHLSPRQAALLTEYIERLETENSSLRKHRARLEHSVISPSRISEMQPFHLEPEK